MSILHEPALRGGDEPYEGNTRVPSPRRSEPSLAPSPSSIVRALGDVDPDRAFYEVGCRPVGGDHRASCKHRTGGSPYRPARAADPAHGLLIDACDAADMIARRCRFWDALQVLRHPEIAALAVTEAREAEVEGYRDARRAARWSLSAYVGAKQALSDALAEVDHAHALLREAHRRGLFRSW